MVNYNPNWSRYNYCRLINKINVFRNYLSNKALTLNDLYAILYNYYKRYGWRWDNGVDERGTKLFFKGDLDNIIQRNFIVNNRDYSLEELKKGYSKRYGDKVIEYLRQTRPFIDEYYKHFEGLEKKKEEKVKEPIQLSLFDENKDIKSKNMKKTITESDLKAMITESVKRIINEISLDTARSAFKKSGEKLDKIPYSDKAGRDKAYRQYNNLYNHFKDRSRENYNPEMPVIICTSDGVKNMVSGDLEKEYEIVGYVEPSQNSRYADQKMIGYPRLRGLIGPMWDGDRLRYEDQETYDILSM